MVDLESLKRSKAHSQLRPWGDISGEAVLSILESGGLHTQITLDMLSCPVKLKAKRCELGNSGA